MDWMVRLSRVADGIAVRRLLLRHDRVYVNFEWRQVEDYLGQSGCYTAIAGHQVIGLVICAEEAVPAGWVRLVALANGWPAPAVFASLWQAAEQGLANQRVTELGLLNPPFWLNNLLPDLQPFVAVVAYAWYDAPIPAILNQEVTIRPAFLSDLSTLVELDALAFDPLWRHSLDTLRLVFHRVPLFEVAEVASRPVGFQFSSLFNGRGHIIRLTVDPAFQRQGIGSALLAHSLHYFRQQGVRMVTLNTQETNFASRRLYERFGFRLTGDQLMTWRWVIDPAIRPTPL